MNIYRISIIIAVVLMLSGCSGSDGRSFIRPFDKAEKFTVKRFKGEKALSINTAADQPFEWVMGKKITGSLEFDFLFTTKPDIGWENRNIGLKVMNGDADILDLKLDRSMFYSDKEKLVFRKKIKTHVNTGKGGRIRFLIEDNSGMKEDEFDLINLVIIPSVLPDHRKNRNILLITIDTLRADYLGYYRKLKDLYPDKISFSPNLDRIADGNLIFTRAYTPISSTWPALSSIARSRMPFEHGVQRNGDNLEDEDSSIGRQLFRDRYTVSYRANAFQLDIGGFDRVESFFRKDRALKDKAKIFINNNYRKQFFLWLHFLGVHSGYRPSPEILSRIEPVKYTGPVHAAVGPVLKKITSGEKQVTDHDIEHIRNCYAGELLQLDEWIQEIFEVMKEKDIWDNTLIIISADHGEDLYQHNNHFFHHPSIYNTSLHVPLIIKFPGSEHRGVIDQNVSIIDLMPSILDYYSIKTDYRMTGESFMPLVRGEVKRKNRLLFAESENNRIMAIIDDNWKFIYNPGNILPRTQYNNPYPIEVEEFYDLTVDRLESNDLVKSNLPTIYKKMKFDLLNYIKLFELDKKKRDRKKTGEMSEEVKKELRTLGYL